MICRTWLKIVPVAALAIVAVPAFGSNAEATSHQRDLAAPSILVLPHQPGPKDGSVVLRARVEDPSGVRSVTAHVLAPLQSTYAAVPMEPRDDDEYAATVPVAPGLRLSYFVEATDRRGNGPRRAGSSRQPFVATPAGLTPSPAAGGAVRLQEALLAAWPIALLVAALATAGLIFTRRRRRRADERFWRELIAPILRREGPERVEAIHELCSQRRFHPRYGLVTIRTPEALRWLKTIAAMKSLPEQETSPVAPVLAGKAGLRDASGNRTHARAPGEPVERMASASPNASGSGGMTLVELLVVLAILGITVGIGALYLKPLEAPVQTAGEMLDGLLRQTRARAIATTTVHRVRPASNRDLIVEHANTCTAGTWTLDPDLKLELPPDVTLSDTAWSVCFTSRGIASANLIVTLDHPDLQSHQLEIMAGGAVRHLY